MAGAFRAGAADVVPKTDDAIPYLRDRVLSAAQAVRATIDRDKLFEEVAEIHESFLKEMMDFSRHVMDLEDKLLRGDGEVSSTSVPAVFDVLCVDDGDVIPSRLARELNPETGWRLRVVQTGGEALDAATQRPPHVLVAGIRSPICR